MKRAVFLATICLLVMLIFAPVAVAQETTPMATPEATPMKAEKTPAAKPEKRKRLAPSGGPAILLPAAALLLGSGVLTYAILRRR